MIQLSPHFTMEEFLYSEKAMENDIDNMPSAAVVDNLMITAAYMETVRKILDGKPIKITSGYRSPELNKAVGGSQSSAHTKGMAVDFVCPEFGTPKQICSAILQAIHSAPLLDLPIDQLIYEGTWVHVGFSKQPRFQILTAIKTHDGKTEYLAGIMDKK